MKKEYMKPFAELNTLRVDNIMFDFSVNNPQLGVDDDKFIDTRDEQRASKNNGKWGDLWGK